MNIRTHQRGFTLIELLLVIVVLGILGTLIGMTYSGVQVKSRNSRREASLNVLKGTLETYYAQTSKYPTLANLNDPAWRASNLKDFNNNDLTDPRWSVKVKACTAGNKVVATNAPAADCYAYQVTAADGSACDNDKTICAHYTLTALLEGGQKYVKGSLN